MTCAICPAEALGQGPYGFLCVPHALIAAGAAPRTPDRPDRTEALRAHQSVRDAFRARTRHLADLGPVRASSQGLEAPQPLAPDRVMLDAIANTMRGLGASVVRVETTKLRAGRRALHLAFTREVDSEACVAASAPAGAPCAWCGSSRSVRGVFRVHARPTVLCTGMDACMARIRKAKAA